MPIDNIPMFSAMNSEEVKPPFCRPHRPLTSQEAHFAIMEKVNACIAEVNNFERRMCADFDNFTDKLTVEDQAFKEAIQAAHNAFLETIQREVNNFEANINNNYDLFREDIDLRIADFETAINSEFAVLQESLCKVVDEKLDEADVKIAEVEEVRVNLLNNFNKYKNTLLEIVNNYKTQIDAHIAEQDSKIEDYKEYMVDNLGTHVERIFNQKAANGEIAEIMAEVYGSDRTFKGSLSYDEIMAISSANNGDYYYCTSDEHYYQRTDSGWVDIGNGDRMADDYEVFKATTIKNFNDVVSSGFIVDTATPSPLKGENGSLSTGTRTINEYYNSIRFDLDVNPTTGFIRGFVRYQRAALDGKNGLKLLIYSDRDVNDILITYGFEIHPMLNTGALNIRTECTSLIKGMNVVDLPFTETYLTMKEENELRETPKEFHINWLIGNLNNPVVRSKVTGNVSLICSIVSEAWLNENQYNSFVFHSYSTQKAVTAEVTDEANVTAWGSNALCSSNAGVRNLLEKTCCGTHVDRGLKNVSFNSRTGSVVALFDRNTRVSNDCGFYVRLGTHEELVGKTLFFKYNTSNGLTLGKKYDINFGAKWGGTTYLSVDSLVSEGDISTLSYDEALQLAVSKGKVDASFNGEVYMMIYNNLSFPSYDGTDGYQYCDLLEGETIAIEVFCFASSDGVIHLPELNALSKRVAALEETGVVDEFGNVKSSNILFGKKYVACGDSFTAGDWNTYVDSTGLTGKDSPEIYDSELKMYKTYPWWIGKRNNMTIVNEALNGSIMPLSKDYLNGENENIDYRHPFSYQRYQNVPEDADYLTIWFGINDAGNTNLGTVNDTTNETFYGSFNVVIPWLLVNRPRLKIGLIITTGSTEAYREAVREIGKRWGIRTLDMRGTETSGMFDKEGMCDEARAIYRGKYYVSEDNSHPNLLAHEHMAANIENFLRTL